MDYSSEVLRRFASPERVGELDESLAGRVAGEAEDRSLKVWVRFEAQVLDERIEQVRFQVYGCPHTIAAASLIAERLEGSAPEALAALDVQELKELLDTPVEKTGKLLRIEDALRACWQAWRRAAEG